MSSEANGRIPVELLKNRRREPPRLVTVSRIETLSPLMRRVVFSGESLAGFGPAKPGAHIKLMFGEFSKSDAANISLSVGDFRSKMRTYTPRYFDEQRLELSVDFLLHGSGLASEWVSQAQIGDSLHIGGPGGGADVDPSLKAAVIMVDETAMPMAGMILDALPTMCRVSLVCEVVDSAEQRQLSHRMPNEIRWLIRNESQSKPGELLLLAAQEIQLEQDAHWWVACESAAMREIKGHLVSVRCMERARLTSRGYWQLGQTNYPDHDHGE
jgi:NADPH-dependent ferric siderophore reductase